MKLPSAKVNIDCSERLLSIAHLIQVVESRFNPSITERRAELIAYFTATWYMAIYGSPLFPDNIYATSQGPEIENFPFTLHKSGDSTSSPTDDDLAYRLVLASCKAFSSFSTSKIEMASMISGSPWAIARAGTSSKSKVLIYPDVMKNYFWLAAKDDLIQN